MFRVWWARTIQKFSSFLVCNIFYTLYNNRCQNFDRFLPFRFKYQIIRVEIVLGPHDLKKIEKSEYFSLT